MPLLDLNCDQLVGWLPPHTLHSMPQRRRKAAHEPTTHVEDVKDAQKKPTKRAKREGIETKAALEGAFRHLAHALAMVRAQGLLSVH